MEFGRLGVWTWLDALPGGEAVAFTARIAALGYRALWLPEAVGRDPFALIACLAARTEGIGFCTGIANIYARDAVTMRAIQQTLGELAPGRFALGLGVSHAHLVSGVRGHDYEKPVATMSAYLDAMEKALYVGPKPAVEAPIVLAALRPKMLALAAAKTRGAHPYFVPPEHTERAREILGKGPLLLPEQKVLLETDASKARAAARAAMKIYLGPPELPEQPALARLRRTTSRTAAATGSWTRSSPGATRRRSQRACRRTTTPAQTTSASSRCGATASRCPTSASSRRSRPAARAPR